MEISGWFVFALFFLALTIALLLQMRRTWKARPRRAEEPLEREEREPEEGCTCDSHPGELCAVHDASMMW